MARWYHKPFDQNSPYDYLEYLVTIQKNIGSPTILIPTSDELSEFVSENRRELRHYFLFPDMPIELVRGLASKKEMFRIATDCRIPTPSTLFPRNIDDVLEYAKKISFPVMLKGIYGNRLQERTGKKMIPAYSKDELIHLYNTMEDPEEPNIMLQELIPGGDDQVYIFNGYFNSESDCLAAYTGYKVRQSPIHVGCASLGECRWNREVARLTMKFMKCVGYRGILDIGYRLDPRDGQYKVLDVNPRVGQAFRIFVSHNGLDVIRALYLDLTNQAIPTSAPREGRRWIIEDFDFIFSILPYFMEGSLGVGEWLRSFRGIEECAWFDYRDPAPFLKLSRYYSKRISKWALKKIRLQISSGDTQIH